MLRLRWSGFLQGDAHTRGTARDQAANALLAKCDILWAQLDAIYFSYVEPGWPPPGAFRIEGK